MNDGETYIVIRNWDKFQHPDVTRSGAPPWIKLYTRLLHDDNYLQLSGHRRAILCGLWLEYASSSRSIRLDTRSITRRLNLRVTTKDLEALNHAGFLEFLQAPCLHRASSRARSREEKKREELTTYEKEARPLQKSGDGEKLERIDYEDLLKAVTGVAEDA